MKSPILGLAVSTLAFAGSSIYLWTQLAEQRARADEVTELARRLNARIDELEKVREQVAHLRLANDAGMNAGSAIVAQPGAAAAPAGPKTESEATQNNFQLPRPDRSPSYQKMMRAQLRANFRRMYADLGSQLRLSQDEFNRFIDLLSDQQLANEVRAFNSPSTSEAEMRQRWEQQRREHQKQIAELLGADKAEEFRQYQESMPARGEVEMIARQLEGFDAPLRDDQRKQLVAVISEERARVPMPQYEDILDQQAYMRLADDWQADYEQRVNAQARAILDNEQFNAYSEYQQWQKEMREQFAVSSRMIAPVTGPGSRGNVVYAAPAAGFTVSAVPAPPPEPEKKK